MVTAERTEKNEDQKNMNDDWITGGDNQKIGIMTRWQKRESRSLGMSPVLFNTLFSLLVIIPVFG